MGARSLDRSLNGLEGRDGLPLSVVMPVYNEEGLVRPTVEKWLSALRDERIDFEVIVLDDGSTDRTPALLASLAKEAPELFVSTSPNTGHGPAILRGYRQARGNWILQVDSDGEVSPGDFPRFWARRDDFDFLLGSREGRRRGWARNGLSRAAGFLARICFGSRFQDVNCPFRLMRRSFLSSYLPLIPPSMFAPNLALSGFAARDGWRCLEIPISWTPRSAGAGLRITSRLVLSVLRSAQLLVRLSRASLPQ